MTHELKHIFNKFNQGNIAIKQKYGGNGLGLSIVSNLLNLMNGELKVQSIIDEGSTFLIKLKLKTSLTNKEQIIPKNNINVLIIDNMIDSTLFKNKSELYGLNCQIQDDIDSAIEVITEKQEKNEIFDYLFISANDKSFNNNIIKLVSLINREKTEIILTSYSKKQYSSEISFRTIRRPLLFSSILDEINEIENLSNFIEKENNDNFFGMKVLLVEDNEINKFVAIKILTAKGVEVEYANNGKKAFELFNNMGDDYFDMILIDKKMPIMDGIEATKEIRKSKLNYSSKIPIYGLSANNTNKAIKECLDAGMNGYLTKPIDIKQLYKILKNIYYK